MRNFLSTKLSKYNNFCICSDSFNFYWWIFCACGLIRCSCSMSYIYSKKILLKTIFEQNMLVTSSTLEIELLITNILIIFSVVYHEFAKVLLAKKGFFFFLICAHSYRWASATVRRIILLMDKVQCLRAKFENSIQIDSLSIIFRIQYFHVGTKCLWLRRNYFSTWISIGMISESCVKNILVTIGTVKCINGIFKR